jgi:hypothetical protein
VLYNKTASTGRLCQRHFDNGNCVEAFKHRLLLSSASAASFGPSSSVVLKELIIYQKLIGEVPIADRLSM